MTIMELLVSLVILGAAMAALVQLVVLTARQRRSLDQRRVALQEVANQAERLALVAWDETTPEKLKTWQPSADLVAALPRATCQASARDESGEPARRSAAVGPRRVVAGDPPAG
jgi:Tfp pilus assembly protein PilV